MPPLSRRRLLALSSVSLTALGGCSTSETDPVGVVLAGIEFGNATAEPLTFHYLVENEDEIVSWSSREVEPDAGEEQTGFETFVPDVSADPGPITVHCRVGDQRATIDFIRDDFGGSDDVDGKCVIGTFIYGFRGENELSTHPIAVDSFEEPPGWVECPRD